MTSLHSGPIQYRPEIDGLRALAVLMVLVVHAFPERMQAGFIGVDVFFVISGFLIASILLIELRAGTFGFVQFYIRRANRIFPALALVLLASLMFGWFALFADEFKSLGRSTAAGAGFVANLNLYREVGYWDVSGKLKPLLHLWSLGVEEQFYFVFPCLLWLTWKKKFNIASVLLVCIVASGLWSNASMTTDRAAAFYLPLQRAWELGAGAVLAYWTMAIADAGQRPPLLIRLNHVLHKVIYSASTEVAANTVNNVAALAGVSMILIAAFGLQPAMPFPGKWALLPVGGAVLLIAAGSHAWINRVVFSNKLMVYIGLISFPLYLWHWPLLSFARIVESGPPASRVRNIAVILSFILAAATYHLLEKPLRRSAIGRGAKAVGLTVLLALTGAAGYYIARHDGISARTIDKYKSADFFAIIRPAAAHDDSNGCFKALPPLFKANLQHGLLVGTEVHCSAKRIDDVTIAMIGDSNAGHFAQDLHARYNDTVLTIHSSGRPFLHGFYDDANSQAILAFLVDQTQIKTIIISHLGVGYVQGEGPAVGVKQVLDPAYEIALKETIALFQAAGKRVILVSSIPILDFEPKGCNARPFAHIGTIGRCTIPHAEILQTHANYLGVIKHLQAGLPQLEVINPMDYLCDAQTCYVKKGGAIFYADRKHLNFMGSALVMQPLIALIDHAPAAQTSKKM
jgi:peptidoglycan/LPS O-acetylase OafA/YrhL